MKKNQIFLITIMMTAALAFSACGGSEKETTAPATEATGAAQTTAPATETAAESTAAQTISMYDMNKAMCAADPNLPEMSRISASDQNAADLFTYFSKLDYDKVESYFLSYAAKGTAEEIGVILLKDERDGDECKKSLEDHLQDRINLYKTYAPEEMARAEKTQILAEGPWVLFIMCDEQQAVIQAFHDFVGK